MATTVADIMTRDVLTMHESTRVATAAKEVAGTDIRHVVVIDNSKVLTGVFSQRDMLRELARSANRREQFGETPLKELNSNTPITARADTAVSEAARLLAQHKVGCLPVVAANGCVVGILSVIDVLQYVARNPV